MIEVGELQIDYINSGDVFSAKSEIGRVNEEVESQKRLQTPADSQI